MTTAHAGWWRRERTVQRPTSNALGGRGAGAIEVLWSTWPLDYLLELEVVGCP